MAFLQRNNPMTTRSNLPSEQQQQQQQQQQPQPSPAQNDPSSPFPSPRTRKQLTLLLAGTTFFALSTLITRRSLTRRYKVTLPKFYQQSNRPNTDVNGATEALEALSLATLNVASLAMMVTGGVLWACDISSMEELRRGVRGGLGVDGSGRREEEEMEEWVVSVLARKEEKERVREITRRKGRSGQDVTEEEEEEGVWRVNERGKPR
ncbi:MAG: hypothetical protein M1830_009213 [Pleopsidium flavum]|nr:MAG: hypothetical protein M1830_009213 [Pleopsidium flavum]